VSALQARLAMKALLCQQLPSLQLYDAISRWLGAIAPAGL
jgi:hypothetical protein